MGWRAGGGAACKDTERGREGHAVCREREGETEEEESEKKS